MDGSAGAFESFLHLRKLGLQPLNSAYLLAAAALSTIYGKLSDILGAQNYPTKYFICLTPESRSETRIVWLNSNILGV